MALIYKEFKGRVLQAAASDIHAETQAAMLQALESKMAELSQKYGLNLDYQCQVNLEIKLI
jgi:hypothetical protein